MAEIKALQFTDGQAVTPPSDASNYFLKNNFAGVVDPTVNDDSGDGYAIGSVWINTVTDKQFICFDATAAAAIWEEAGGAGGGGLDVFYTDDMEGQTLTSQFTTGNNATFDNGGTLDGAISADAATQINGTQSFKYTMGATSANDWMKSEVIVTTQKHQENTIGFEYYYEYNGDDDDIRFVVWDNTNDVELTDEVEFLKASSKSQRFSTQVHLPNGVVSISYGFMVVTGNSAKVLRVDDITGSSSPFISKEGYTEILSENLLTANDTTAGVMTDLTFSNLVIDRDYVISGQIYFNHTTDTVTSVQIDDGVVRIATITKDPGLGTSENQSIPFSYPFTATTTSVTFTSTGISASNVITGNNTKDRTFAQLLEKKTTDQIIAYNSRNAANSMVRLHTGNGHGSTNTVIRRFSTEVTNVGNAITYADSATLGATFTINEYGVYFLSYTDYSTTGAAALGFSLNSTQLTTAITSITDADRLPTEVSGSANQEGSSSWVGILDKDDIIRPHTDGGASATNRANFTITKIGVGDLLGVPTTLTGYLRDEKASGTSGGASATSYTQRDLNTTSGDFSKFGTLSANRFTLDAGIYDISGFATGFKVNGFRVKLVRDPAGTPSDEILGSTGYSESGSNLNTTSLLDDQVIVTSTTTFEIQQDNSLVVATNGLGLAASLGDNELFAQLKIVKKA